MGYLCIDTIAEWSRWLAHHFDLVGCRFEFYFRELTF